MPNSYFQFKQFLIEQDLCGMKVTTDACLFGAIIANRLNNHTGDILDIGTGTGLLSLMLAQQTKGKIEAIEIDSAAFTQAKANFQISRWKDRLTIKHTSFQDYAALAQKNGSDGKFDHLICNPPFFSQHLTGHDKSKNQALHDENALLPALVASVRDLLKPQGQLHLLLPAFEMSQFVDKAIKNGLYPQAAMVVHQRFEKPVFRHIVSFGLKEVKEVSESSIYIYGRGREYSEAFISLLSPYYLHL